MQVRVQNPSRLLFNLFALNQSGKVNFAALSQLFEAGASKIEPSRVPRVIIESAGTKKHHSCPRNFSHCMCFCKTGSMSDTILTSQQFLEANKGKKIRLVSPVSHTTAWRPVCSKKSFLIALHWLFCIKTITVDRS